MSTAINLKNSFSYQKFLHPKWRKPLIHKLSFVEKTFGEAIAPDTKNFIPCSTVMSRKTTSSFGKSMVNPEIGVGVEGIKTATSSSFVSFRSISISLVRNPRQNIPFLGNSTKTTCLNDSFSVVVKASTNRLEEP